MRSRILILLSAKSIILFLVISSAVYAQADNARPLPQFLFPGFGSGIVKSKSGPYLTFKLNYDMLDEKMVTEKGGVYRLLGNIEDVDTVYLQGRIFVPIDNFFCELVAVGDAPFFIRYKCYLVSSGTTVGYGVKSQGVGPTEYRRFELGSDVVNIDLPPDNNVEVSSVNMVRVNDKIQKFANERQLKKLFPDHARQLEEYFKTNNVDFKSREFIVKLGAFCNSLLDSGK